MDDILLEIDNKSMTNRLERGGLGLQLGVRQRLILIGQRLDLIGDRVDGFQLPLAVSTKNLLKQSH